MSICKTIHTFWDSNCIQIGLVMVLYSSLSVKFLLWLLANLRRRKWKSLRSELQLNAAGLKKHFTGVLWGALKMSSSWLIYETMRLVMVMVMVCTAVYEPKPSLEIVHWPSSIPVSTRGVSSGKVIPMKNFHPYLIFVISFYTGKILRE